jgi:hypothetical protein
MAEATAGIANTGNAAALATNERRDKIDIAFPFLGVCECTGQVGMPLNFLLLVLSVMTRLCIGALWQVPARRYNGASGRNQNLA